MANQRLRVAIVSPGDVQEERTAAIEIIDELRTRASKFGFRIEVVKWENVPAGFYPTGLQEQIDEKLALDDCDIVLGIFWKRYGVVDASAFKNSSRNHYCDEFEAQAG
jgi:hypothetical protein